MFIASQIPPPHHTFLLPVSLGVLSSDSLCRHGSLPSTRMVVGQAPVSFVAGHGDRSTMDHTLCGLRLVDLVHNLFLHKINLKFLGKYMILTKTPLSYIEIAIKSLVLNGTGFQLPFYIQTPRLLPNYTNTPVFLHIRPSQHSIFLNMPLYLSKILI
jgi:hypothetical protein